MKTSSSCSNIDAPHTVSTIQVIILARESGLKLELSDIPVDNLVPEPLRVRIQFSPIIDLTVELLGIYFMMHLSDYSM